MYIKALILTLFVIFCQSAGYSQSGDLDFLKDFRLVQEDGETVAEVGLADILRLSLQRGNTVEMLEINRRIAEENLKAAKKALNPYLTTSFQLGRDISPYLLKGVFENMGMSQMDPGAVTLSGSDMGVFSTSWNQKLYSGVAYSLTYQKLYRGGVSGKYEEWGDDFSGWSGADEVIYVDSLSLSLQAPIFQDWGDINKMAEHKSMTALKQTNAESKQSTLELLKTVANIYWDMVAVVESVKALKAGLKLSEQLVEDTKIQSNLGVLDPIEIKQTESQAAMDRQNLTREIANKKGIEDQVKMLLNMEDFSYGYKPTEKLNDKKGDFNFETLLQKVYQNSQDLELLKIALENNRLDLKEALNKAKTDIDFNAEYKLNSYENSFKSSGRVEPNLNTYKVGLTWKVPFFDKLTPQKINKLKLEKTRIKLQIDDKKSQLKTDLKNIFRNLELNRKEIELAGITRSLVEDLFYKETERYKEGKSTAFRVSQRHKDMITAQKDEILSKIRYEKTFLSLLTITEQIFAYYKL